ncbi:MAG TPA: Rrf2 family transcriptional regulator [Chitinophagaceae bacterium]|nr:Rrf2 family transcriptional regulator [Chitinophagaceae bacterium]
MLSKKAKYAINALVYLARENKGNEPIQISTIAKNEKIPRKFLEAILLDLKNAGMLNSKKGKAGGYFLQKSADEINIADVIRLFDGAIALIPCVAHLYYARCEECRDEATCGIRDVFAEIRLETVKMLKNATLTDIVQREQRLSGKKEMA